MALPRYLSAHEVSALLSMSYDAALRVMSKAGAKKIGGLVRVSETALESHLESCPSHARVHTYTAARGDSAYTPTSTGTTKTSPLKPRTKRKPTSGLPSCLTHADYVRSRKAGIR